MSAASTLPASSVPQGKTDTAGRRAATTLVAGFEYVVLGYLVSLIYLYPYGVPLSVDVSLRLTDLFALLALVFGASAILLRARTRIDRTLMAVIGGFVLLELYLPIVGAMGYRRPVDIVSSVRMAMVWLPMIFLTMLAPPWRAVTFEKRLATVLKAALWINFTYAVMQIASVIGVVPRAALITTWLEPWVVDKGYDIIQGLRPAGFFDRSTALSVFGIVCLCFFYARFVADRDRSDLVHSLLAIALVILTTSRAAYFASAAIVFAGWCLLPRDGKIVMAAILIAGAVAVLMLVDSTIGIDVAFGRFQRLAESGLLADASFGERVNVIWPTALEAARDYRVGTLIQSPRALPLIDSGYLTYYLQGKWLFVGALAIMLAGQWYLGVRSFFGPRARRVGVMVLYVAIFLTGALVISNPLRTPLMAFFIVYSIWRDSAERSCRRMAVMTDDALTASVGLQRS